MREILFRGKRIDNGEWLECATILHAKNENEDFINMPKIGDPCNVGENEEGNIVSIPVCSFYAVDPKSLGQYTGWKDKNGKRIFEGDILAFPDTGEDGYEYKEGYDFTNVATVCWNNGRWELEDFGDENSGVKDDMDVWHWDFVAVFPVSEVIGNIHDNPEMIGGEEE